MLKELSPKTKIQLISIILLSILALSLLISQSANPAMSLFFNMKRVQEKAYMKFKTTPEARLDYMSVLLDNRLGELESLVKNKNYTFLLTSSLRYSTLAGQMTELVVSNNLKDKAVGTKAQFNNHKKILNDLYIAYPKNTDNLEYKYLEDDMNYLDLYLEKLNQVKK